MNEDKVSISQTRITMVNDPTNSRAANYRQILIFILENKNTIVNAYDSKTAPSILTPTHCRSLVHKTPNITHGVIRAQWHKLENRNQKLYLKTERHGEIHSQPPPPPPNRAKLSCCRSFPVRYRWRKMTNFKAANLLPAEPFLSFPAPG